VEHAIATNSNIEPMETFVTCKDGSTKIMSWGFFNIGKQSWASGLDLTETKQATEELVKYRDKLQLLVDEQTSELKKAHAELLQQERLATIGQLTATVSHELRNPLGTIQSAIFSIDDSIEKNEPHRAMRSLELAERSINRCVNIIEELINYARVKELNVSTGSIDDWLLTVIGDQIIPEDILVELDLSCGVQVHFDPSKLQQVINNLLDNAVHALKDSHANGKLLQISTSLLDGIYEIRICDNGVGMSDDIKERLFEPLFSTRNFGVGLGMVVVKNIVEQHHGQVFIESKEGAGTSVNIQLPIQGPT
jgi:signal transduction histidine kinase